MAVTLVAVSLPPLTRSPSPLGVEAVAQFLERVAAAAPDVRVLSVTLDELMVASRAAPGGEFASRRATAPRRGVPNASSGADSARIWDPSADGADGCVIVPLALSCTPHDAAALLAAARVFSGVTPSVVAQPWGPDGRVVDALIDRLLGVGLRASDRVVLDCAEASDLGVADAAATRSMLSSSLGIAVALGFSDTAPAAPSDVQIVSTEDAIARERAQSPGSRVIVSSYSLTGNAAASAQASAAERVAPPLLAADEGPPQSLVDLLLERFYAAADQLDNARLETVVSEPPLGLA
ncbi:sirohydrochlorin chelatase [Salinibacterium hongtaonis]|uniref:sirohydrochlorin chelatase n=1 Tax=Homoserinimonas hongtaonis TaxID=2079791 RepID=UPI000D393A96|nr:hypothetical protein [Salinibacterium hongtaonis]AWB89615.1 hypothetical protein C2138_08730 [Salinibacterium hongtaonis]